MPETAFRDRMDRRALDPRHIKHEVREVMRLGLSGLRGSGSRSGIIVGGQVRSQKTQPFQIVNRYRAYKMESNETEEKVFNPANLNGNHIN